MFGNSWVFFEPCDNVSVWGLLQMDSTRSQKKPDLPPPISTGADRREFCPSAFFSVHPQHVAAPFSWYFEILP